MFVTSEKAEISLSMRKVMVLQQSTLLESKLQPSKKRGIPAPKLPQPVEKSCHCAKRTRLRAKSRLRRLCSVTKSGHSAVGISPLRGVGERCLPVLCAKIDGIFLVRVDTWYLSSGRFPRQFDNWLGMTQTWKCFWHRVVPLYLSSGGFSRQ